MRSPSFPASSTLLVLTLFLAAGATPTGARVEEGGREIRVPAPREARAGSRPAFAERPVVAAPDEAGGDDVLIVAHPGMEASFRGESFDIAESGDLYAAVEILTGEGSEIRVYRSQDGGDTWALWGTKSDPDPNVHYREPVVHVAEGNQDRLYLGYQRRVDEPDDRDIWVSYAPLAGATAAWTDRNVLDQPGIAFEFPDLSSDAEVNGAFRLFVVATGVETTTTGDDVWFSSSTDFGATWSPEFVFFALPDFDMWYPRVRYGRGGIVHFIWEMIYRGGSFPATVAYRRAPNFGATYADFSDTTWYLTTGGDIYRENDPQIAASHGSDNVVVTFTRTDSSTHGLRPARVLASGNAGFSWTDTGETMFDEVLRSTALVALPGTAGFRATGWNFLDGMGVQGATDAAPKSWGAVTSLSDRSYITTSTPEPSLDYDATHGDRIGLVWRVRHGGAGLDSLMFDAEWRRDPGYPNLAAGFPVALPFDVISPPAICELDGDPEGEIVFGDAQGFIRAHHHDGTVVAGWPVDIGTIPADSPVAVGDLDGDGDHEVVCGNTVGQVHAFNADGSVVPGWPVSLGVAAPAYAAIGALLPGTNRQVAAVAGGYQTLLFADGSPARGWPLYRAFAASVASPSIGDVDGDGDREVVTAVGGRVYVHRGDATLQMTRGSFGPGPVRTFSNALSLADFNLDGDLEVVAPSDQGDVFVIQPDSTDLPGWPYADPLGARITSVAVANIRSLGDPEVGFAVESAANPTVHARTSANVELSGYPHATGAGWLLLGAPIFDVLDEGSPDLVIGSRDGSGWAWDNFGRELEGWPKTLGKSHVSAASGDLDQDGDLEIVYTTVEVPQLVVVDVNAAVSRQATRRTWFWPMYGYNAQRTSCHACGSDAVVDAGGGAAAGTLTFAAPWPNPASGTSSFRFSLPVGGPVRLELFDVSGRRIRELLKAEMDGGVHEHRWDGRDDDGGRAPSGVYYARLSFADEVAVRKLTLLH